MKKSHNTCISNELNEKKFVGAIIMKKIIVVLLAVLLANVSLFSKGNFYAVYVIDNELADMNCVESLFAWQNEMNKIHNYGRMITKERVLAVGLSSSMEEWSREAVLAAIDDVKPDEQDTVLFFFAGKSEKIAEDNLNQSEQKSRYPGMLLQHGTSLELEEVAGVLAKKRPGLLLVLADFYDQTGNVLSENESVSRANRSVVYGNYRKLFNEKRHATVIAASCSAGNRGEGGVFTQSFFKALKECTASGNATWQGLLEKVSQASGPLQNKACWEIRPQKDFANRVDFTIEEFDLPEWTDSWDENWYDDQEWYDDGGWSGEVYENDEEYYAEDEMLTGEDDE